MKQHKTLSQRGFTLIELMIATTVFSVILLAAATTLIQIGRLYYKAIIISKTQNVTRTVTDDLSRSIQFSSGNLQRANSTDVGQPLPDEPIIRAICFGNTRYTYVEKAQVADAAADGSYDPATGKIRHVLWKDTIFSEQCGNELPNLLISNPNAGSLANRNGRELLDNNMRLQRFSVDALTGGADIFDVNVKVVYYADSDLLNNFNDPTACKGSVVGGQWCAISDLSSVVYSRAR